MLRRRIASAEGQDHPVGGVRGTTRDRLVGLERIDQGMLNRAWDEAASSLPVGWRIEGVTCTSSGLGPAQRDDRWRATGVGPAGEHVEAEADSPVGALQLLGQLLSARNGSHAG